MSLPLSEEQTALADSLKRFLSERCPAEYIARRANEMTPTDRSLWGDLKQLGLFDYFSDPASLFRDLSLVAFECGAALLPESLVDRLFAGPFLFSHLTPTTTLSDDLARLGYQLSSIAGGESLVGIAPLPASIAVETAPVSGLRTLTGSIPLVGGASSSSLLLLSIREGEKSALALCDLASTGAAAASIPEAVVDKTEKRYRVELNKALALPLGGTATGDITYRYLALKSAEMAGVASYAVRLTTEYVKQRKQFGVPVGSFQAVQHRLADMFLASKSMAALADFAAWTADSSTHQLPLAALSAIRFATENGPKIVEGAIQLHGGIGFTYEYPLHYYLRRMKLNEALFSPSEDQDRELLMAAGY